MNQQDRLSQEERSILLKLARQAIEEAVCRGVQLSIELGQLSQILQDNGASFVTLTKRGELRGCIGSLEASQPLVMDVCDHAAAAALSDYRFPPVARDEVSELVIEISRLTIPIPLEYDDPSELLSVLRPGIDGVVIRDGSYRATFLPQVWEKIPDAQQFLSYLCRKMGVNAGLWRLKKLQILTYQVEDFHE